MEDIRDIAGPLAVPMIPVWVWWAAGVMLLAMLAGVIFSLWQKRRRPPVIAPRDAALKAFAEMEPKVDTLLPHDFGVEVSDILRTWVTKAHQIPATRQTSQEFLEAVRHQSVFDSEQQTRMGTFLSVCDRLKFAPAEGSASECRSVLEQAREIVTAPLPTLQEVKK